jgi:UDP-glucose 4-epimerase
MIKEKRILISGGAGFVGSHIADLAVFLGWKVAILDNLSTGKESNLNPSATFFRSSITDYPSLKSIVDIVRPDVICHQAAQPSLRTSLEKPAFDAQTNIIGTINVIEAAKEVGAHVILASTSAVYDATGNLPYLEDDDISPHLPYGISKAAAEMYVINSGISATVLRYGNAYGPRQLEVGENQLVPHCVHHLLHKTPFKINGDGMRSRDLIYVGDVARANMMVAEAKPQGVYNIANGVSFTINEVCAALAYHCRKPDYKFEYGEAKAGEAEHTLLHPGKAFETFGWKAETKLEDGLRRVVEWEKKQVRK